MTDQLIDDTRSARCRRALDQITDLTLADCLAHFGAKTSVRDAEIAALVDTNDDLEVDYALLSETDENGAWVNAWAWVSFAGTKFDKDQQ